MPSREELAEFIGSDALADAIIRRWPHVETADPVPCGPWPRCSDVPDGVTYTSRRTPWHTWVNRGGRRFLVQCGGEVLSEADGPTMRERAPFRRTARAS